MNKKICIINTGGTISMTRTENGYAPVRGFMEKALFQIRSMAGDEMPSFEMIEYDPLLDSSSIAVKEWVQIASDIEKYYSRYDGFVILHGTDTMAYTASALSFMLEGLSKPVILTGSQIPIGELRNDARDNLITALMLAAESDIAEVGLFFRNKLFRGNRTTKISSDDFIAFDSPNFPPLADAETRIILNRPLLRKSSDCGLCFQPFGQPKIAVLKMFPGIRFELFEKILTPDLKGIVIEAFGAGNIPDSHGALLGLMEKARDNGTVIVVCTQCVRGSAILGQYESSRDLVEAGAVSGYDLTVEAAVTKLYHLLSIGCDPQMVRQKMTVDLRGEITLPESK